MHRFQYRAYYAYNGPSKVEPFRSELSAEEVEDALSSFSRHLEHYLKPGAVVEADEYEPGARDRVFSVETDSDRAATNEAVASCLTSFDLYADVL
ncbi:hypothetical protein RI103_38720 (plasmid) [Paraburkholderia sp. FT54]|uniref:hypothetical protein n=1 Tax=Paraburkholderia sp. FT54 TaxID=3074437 RepID=UPI0028772712|nr:hypothetical protein [Paraburkholderia sp. FT54]WNC95221.1 hypothetical protein RI103_38720 [Paraburkholderia sp. FT54]